MKWKPMSISYLEIYLSTPCTNIYDERENVEMFMYMLVKNR